MQAVGEHPCEKNKKPKAAAGSESESLTNVSDLSKSPPISTFSITPSKVKKYNLKPEGKHQAPGRYLKISPKPQPSSEGQSVPYALYIDCDSKGITIQHGHFVYYSNPTDGKLAGPVK